MIDAIRIRHDTVNSMMDSVRFIEVPLFYKFKFIGGMILPRIIGIINGVEIVNNCREIIYGLSIAPPWKLWYNAK